MIDVIINGAKEKIKEGSSVAAVLTGRNVEPRMVAVEVNGVLIDKEDYDSLDLKSGDRLEYLFYMAGGGCSRREVDSLP